MQFVGRARELARLKQCYATAQQEAVLIYGRRRIGKSELIKYFLQRVDGAGVYYECKQTTEQDNVASLAQVWAEQQHLPPLAFAGIEALLTYFFEQAQQQKLILVLDEYPYLRQTVKGMDSILQTLLDKYAARSQLKLILCGSFVETMQALLMAHNPLYGRITLTLNLQPMDYYEAAAFYPNCSLADRVRLYSVFGGVPYYNRLIDDTRSVRDNILTLLVTPGARLENEILLYLQGELARFNNANAAFVAMTQGFSRFNDILAQSHLASAQALTDVLKRLMLMGVVRKEAPINDQHNRKKAGYFISDPLSAFFYRYLFRYASQRQVMLPEAFFARYIAEDFSQAYVPRAFEQICRQFLVRQNLRGVLPKPFEQIGKYYYDMPQEHRNGEFDVVTQNAQGYTFYEAKFRDQPITSAMIETEIQQVNATGLQCQQYGFFSRSGFDLSEPLRPDVVTYTLQDMYKVSYS